MIIATLEHLKRLEGEVLGAAAGFGENFLLDLATHSVDPHQFLGLELNPRDHVERVTRFVESPGILSSTAANKSAQQRRGYIGRGAFF